jgi:glycosyltransferase involved in cell wall biosynthesis
MNLCLLSYRGNPYCGGQGVYLYFLSRELARMGHTLTVLVGPPNPWPMPWARTIPVESLNLWGVRRNFLPPAVPWRIFRPLNFFEFAATRFGFFPEMFIFSLRAARILKGLFPGHNFDLFHDVQSLGYGLLLVKQFRRPLVTTVHHPLTVDFRHSLERDRNFTEKYYTLVFYPLRMQGRVIRRCDRVLTSSRETAREIERDFGVRADRIRNVANGLDTEFFRPGNGTPRKSHPLLFVGNTDDPKKGIRYLLEAMTHLPEKIRLTIVDDGTPLKTFAPDLARKLGVAGRVTFTGKLSAEDLRREYQSAQVTVVPSLYEGFGLPAAESLACATPVVATTAGALPEVVGEEGTGFLVPPRDARALAAGIQQALEDEGGREKMGRTGRERVVNLFSWRSVAERTVEVYKELMSS